MTLQDRITGARAYLAKLPPAIAGQGGHPATYRAASILANGFELGYDEAWMLLTEWNTSHCSPNWSEKDLRHKLNDAFVKPHERPRGWLARGKERRVGANGRLIFDPRAVAEIVQAQTPLCTADVLIHCFKDEDIVCITNEAGQTEEGKWFPASKGMFLTRAEWLAKFFGPDAKQGKHFKDTEQGAWVRINPFTKGDYTGTDASVATYRHVLVEFDNKSKDEQLAIFQQSNLPISLLVESGGKSVHAWVRVDAVDKAQWEERRNRVYEYLADHEPDPQNKNPSRWSRLGGIMRGEKEQKIVAFNIGASDWDDFSAWSEGQDVPADLGLDVLLNYDFKNDPNKMVGNGRYLCKGASLLITGQSGIGKSSFVMQMALSWATGRELFGIPCVRPLRIGVVQAECDIGDLSESLQGVCSGMSLRPEEFDLIRDNLKFFMESGKTGKDFTDLVRKLITRHKLDMIVVDPLLAYIGGDINKQEVCSNFLRTLIDPILKETGCIMVIIHHEGKPKAKEVLEEQTISDMMYSGTGSAELVNWARAIISVRRESKDKPVFSFNLTKRGKEAGMRHPDGKPTLSIKLKHAEHKVLWEIAPMVAAFELLKVGQQYAYYATKPRLSRKALLDELTGEHNLQFAQAESLIKAMVTNAIIRPRKVGAALYYEGTKVDEPKTE